MFPFLLVLILGLNYSLTGGVPHPPGYPLYLLFARLFQWLPLGPLAFRTNLLSGVCTVLACILLYKFLQKRLEGRPYAIWISFLSALAFGLAPQVWSQAVITEVYALHNLLIVLILLSLYADRFPAGDLGRGVLFGLAAGNHLTILFLLPLLLLNYGGSNSLLGSWPVILRRAAGLLGGLIIYLSLPLRAALGSPVNWYNPVTPENFANLITAGVYRSYLFSLSAADTVLRVRNMAGLLLHQYTIAGVLLGLYGLFSRPPRTILIISSWMFIIFSLFAIAYGSYDSNIYLMPAYLAFVLWIAFGLEDLVEGFPSKAFQYRWIMLLVLFCGVLLRIPSYFQDVNASDDFRAETFGRQFVRTVPVNAIVFAREDREVFGLWYFRDALGQRADVIVIAGGLLQFDWYLNTLAQTYPDLVIPRWSRVSFLDLVSANPERPLCIIDESGTCK